MLSRWFPARRRPRTDAVGALEPWTPSIPPCLNGYVTSGHEQALLEACRRLSVEIVGRPIHGYTRKSIGAAVAGADGTRSWIKVTGRHDPHGDVMRGNEIAAGLLAGLPKPAVLAHAEWLSQDVHWRALQMTLAPSPVVETTPWPGERARMVTDGWIERLRDALGNLGRVQSDRSHLPPDRLGSLIRSRFGDAAPCVADEWRVSYCEAHWANLTAPQLMLLDWELWGLTPRGYDGALIVAFSAADPALIRRLEAAFADDLRTPSGQVSQLAACAQLLGWTEMGLIHPGLRGPLEQLAYRALQRQ